MYGLDHAMQRERLPVLQAEHPRVTADGSGWSPPSLLPSKPALAYTKDAITVFLLLLALPWLVYKLATKPEQLIPALGRSHVQPPSPKTRGIP